MYDSFLKSMFYVFGTVSSWHILTYNGFVMETDITYGVVIGIIAIIALLIHIIKYEL